MRNERIATAQAIAGRAYLSLPVGARMAVVRATAIQTVITTPSCLGHAVIQHIIGEPPPIAAPALVLIAVRINKQVDRTSIFGACMAPRIAQALHPPDCTGRGIHSSHCLRLTPFALLFGVVCGVS
jgi:hypothetical protein